MIDVGDLVATKSIDDPKDLDPIMDDLECHDMEDSYQHDIFYDH